jgi:hypothetical protein
MYEFSNHTTNENEKFIKFTNLKNGFLKDFIDKHHKRHVKKASIYGFKEISYLLFMCSLLLRNIISVFISDGNYTVLMFIGRIWHYLGANYIHNEVLFILWSLNFICVYVFVIQSPTKQYKWIEIYAFLNGILSHQQIGKYYLLFSLSLYKRKLKLKFQTSNSFSKYKIHVNKQ